MSEQPAEEEQEHTVAIEVAVEEDSEGPELGERLDRLREVVADSGGVPLRSTDGRRYGARFHVTGNADQAVESGLETFERAAGAAGVPAEPVVEVEATNLDEVADTGSDVPALVGITEVAELLGVTLQLATVIARFDWFPAPAVELDAGPVWKLSAIQRFLQLTETDPDTAEKVAEAAGRAKPPASRAVSADKAGPAAEAAEVDEGGPGGDPGEPAESGETADTAEAASGDLSGDP